MDNVTHSNFQPKHCGECFWNRNAGSPVAVRTDGAKATNIEIAIAIQVRYPLSHSTLIMDPTTCRTSGFSPLSSYSERLEADTINKTCFYIVHDKEITFILRRSIARDEKISRSTARCWLKQRENMGFLAYRSSRVRSTNLD